jgi:superfamily II DNA or RNA helicase
MPAGFSGESLAGALLKRIVEMSRAGMNSRADEDEEDDEEFFDDGDDEDESSEGSDNQGILASPVHGAGVSHIIALPGPPAAPGHTDPLNVFTPDQLQQRWNTIVFRFQGSQGSQYRWGGRSSAGVVTLTSFNPRGNATFRWDDSRKTCDVTLEADLFRSSYKTKCTSCSLDRCVHQLEVSDFLAKQLRDQDSDVMRSIHGRDDPERMYRRTMSLLETMRLDLPAISAIDIEATDSALAYRYLWNIDLQTDGGDGRSLSVVPIRQQENKNGGWSRGRAVSLSQFLKDGDKHWSQLDRRLASVISHKSWSTVPEIAVVDAIPLMAGSDGVQLNRENCRIEFQPLEIIVTEIADGFLLTTSPFEVYRRINGADAVRVISILPKMVLVVNPQAGQITAFRCSDAAVRLVQHLYSDPLIVPREKTDDLLKTLDTLQETAMVQLPDSLGGPEVAVDPEPVVLLMLRKTGDLEVTMCVRDSHQNYLMPGTGMLRRHGKLEGQRVQFVRNGSHEIHRAKELSDVLGLEGLPSESEWKWIINSPGLVADFMAATGELVSAKRLTVVWHRQSASQFDVLGKVSASNVRVQVNRQRDWFGITGECTIGDVQIPLKDLLQGTRGTRMSGMIELTPGKWAVISEELRRALRRLSDVSSENRGKLQVDSAAALTVSGLEAFEVKIESDREWEKCLQRVRDAQAMTPDLPEGLNCSLRDYQLDGFRWMCRLSAWGVGGILADDMGLGKTVQTLALLLHRTEHGPALVIAPTSLGFNWQAECERFTPSLSPILFREADRADLLDNVTDGQVIICSYGLALREADRLKKVKWGTLVLDEAQNVKNSNSKTAQQIRQFGASWKVALTGTPMENHLGELWSIFHVVSPGVLGPWEQFRRRFAASIEKERDSDRREALSRVISPFILRRSKSEVLKDLPERSENNLLVDLSPEERQRYDQMRLAAIGELDQLQSEEQSDQPADHRFRILQILTRLRQLACHIGLVDPTWTGSSSKLDELIERLLQLKEQGHRTLVFSQFTSHLALIRKACDENGITSQYLDGKTTPKARKERVEAFQNGHDDVFLISLKAGGTGLNLTAADYVIHMDPWWNPAVEDQATDRAHRIGQTKSVMVYRIIAKGTIEEQILSLHEEKAGPG